MLGTLVSDQEVEPSAPMDAGCGSCTLCIDACPTGALDEPGTLDSTRCLSYWTQAPAPVPEPYRAALGALVYGCDICQDVCPWNRGVEKRRAAERRPPRRPSPRSRSSTGSRRTGTSCVERYDRLYVPRNDPRWLRRNALVAAGNVGGAAERAAVERYADGDDPLLREHAAWALARIDERSRREADPDLSASSGSRSCRWRSRSCCWTGTSFPPGYEAAAWWLLAVQALVAARAPRARVALAAAACGGSRC